MTENAKESCHLFWTGGFDSTFRLCQLLIDEKRLVETIYLACRIDRRQNRSMEIAAMQSIRREILLRFPFTEPLFPPTRIIEESLDTIAPRDEELTSRGLRLVKEKKFPFQYERLCRFAKHYGRTVEIAVEVGCRLERIIAPFVDDFRGFLLDEASLPRELDDLRIFKYLRFPVIRLVKGDMLKIASNGGYARILDLTWSCWYPVGSVACGKCEMCKVRESKRWSDERPKPFLSSERIEKKKELPPLSRNTTISREENSDAGKLVNEALDKGG